MSNPFKKISKTSEETKKKWKGEKKTADIKTNTCNQCGAPRPFNSNLVACSYCGGKFMDIDAVIKADK